MDKYDVEKMLDRGAFMCPDCGGFLECLAWVCMEHTSSPLALPENATTHCADCEKSGLFGLTPEEYSQQDELGKGDDARSRYKDGESC